MSAEDREPWGLIVTGTLHLLGHGLGPACRRSDVTALVERAKAAHRWEWENGRWEWIDGEAEARPIVGYADGRPVCRRCIARDRQLAVFYSERAEQADSYNSEREGNR